MKYTLSMYAQAFVAVTEEKKASPDRVLKGLLQALKRQGDMRLGDAVVREVHKTLVHAKGGRLVRVETARVLPKSLAQSIRDAFEPEDDISFAERPELVAGIRIVMDDELELDGSLRRKLNSMFTV